MQYSFCIQFHCIISGRHRGPCQTPQPGRETLQANLHLLQTPLVVRHGVLLPQVHLSNPLEVQDSRQIFATNTPRGGFQRLGLQGVPEVRPQRGPAPERGAGLRQEAGVAEKRPGRHYFGVVAERDGIRFVLYRRGQVQWGHGGGIPHRLSGQVGVQPKIYAIQLKV